MGMTESEIFHFESQQDWANWLEVNYDKSPGIWLRIGKKNTGIKSVTHPEALETAICYGWIDAIRKSYDAQTWLQRFTPRKPGSKWSTINREKAIKLIDSGLMLPSGLATVNLAQENGSWERAYEPQSTINVPQDFKEELNKNKAARLFFETLDSRNRYAILHRIQTAVKVETRQKKIAKFIDMLEANQKIY
jgi:uncharacterized protein YdeI (YjbR/CyaY-like superfamily)